MSFESTEPYIGLLNQTAQYACDYIQTTKQRPPFPDESSVLALDTFDEEFPAIGADAAAIMQQLHETGSPGTTGVTGGRYFGFVNGGLLPIAHAAQWLMDTWNQNTALYVMSPAAAKLEDLCERWIVKLLGLEPGTAMGLVTGSSNALICALAAARNELLRRQGYDLPKMGLRNAPPFRVVMGAGAHSAVSAALSVLGIGRQEVETVPVDRYGRIDPQQVPKLDAHTLLILQAGHVCGGSFDPIDELCDRARAAGAWVHIDGAFGLWAAASRKQRHLTAGLEKADSWSVDAHKTLNAGYDCGIVLCRDRAALTSALQANGAYIQYSDNRDGMNYTTEMSRRGRGIILWAVLKQLGAEGVEKLINQLCDHAAYFADSLEKAGLTLVNPPCFNQFMVKCASPQQTKQVLEAVQNSGICWCGGSEWEGEPVIRVSVCSHATTKEDIDLSVTAFKKAFMEMK